ncbi:TetR/AcrR family transcriptional regulator [Nocardia sp. NPDC059246]|uniref:TetR/AcrR family transcriptional regulator n=1 Tax=unclassified Nocardia TaxID=2637762 RepID=UPI0036BBCFFB
MTESDRAVPFGEGRQAILHAAIRLVAREGLSKCTYRSLAQEARVAVGLVRHHFTSLDDVFENALGVVYEVHAKRLKEASGFQGLIDMLAATIEGELEYTQFELEVLVGARHRPSLHRAAEEYYAEIRRFTAAALVSAGQSADQGTVELLTALADGIAYERIVLGQSQIPRMRAQLEALQRLLPSSLTGVPTGLGAARA